MAKRRGRVLVGTSGWSYDHWRGAFYPEDLPKSRWLDHYVERFPAVELNNTYYRFPSKKAVERWRTGVPDGFRFVLKAHRRITHRKRLTDVWDTTRDFVEMTDRLGDRLAAILFQLPPRFGVDAERLRAFLARLPPERRYVFEFRDPSWHVDEVREVLSDHDAAFCMHDFGGERSPRWVTSDLVYVRFHGPERPYEGLYGGRRLAPWAKRIDDWRDRGLDVLCFFNNDEAANATKDAAWLLERVGRPEQRASPR